ncbi:Photosystem II PsbP [Macleaya cordata]|uniref:Photosystem II PsbP n=1 Tax=Macleaya cordata TaxID=56857 RepID=A0A200Q1H1_MACCD|nr:Photosystem II PsbP [Macleaya cordata]
MALQNCLYAGKTVSLRRINVTQLPGDQKDRSLEVTPLPRPGRSPAEEFAPLASVFQRRFLVGVGSASLVALGANFIGITSFLLGLLPETGRSLKLDVLYPVEGYSRCLETNEGFESIYPASWVGDQTLLYRAAGKAESERSLDPPALNDTNSNTRLRGNSVNEPVVAFGPPGSNGELNVSVIVSPVPRDFSIEAFGGPKEVGEAVIKTITGSKRQAASGVKASLIESTVKEDPVGKVNYYKLEFRVESPSFRRHNIAVCCARDGRLFTLNAQAPELVWSTVKQQFHTIADSFNLVTS